MDGCREFARKSVGVKSIGAESNLSFPINHNYGRKGIDGIEPVKAVGKNDLCVWLILLQVRTNQGFIFVAVCGKKCHRRATLKFGGHAGE